MGNVVVVGAQWGDEGKGKIVDWLSERADVIARFQGGHNAGHTLVIDGTVYKLSLLPSGIVRPGKLSVIGNGVVLDPWALLAEIEKLAGQGVTIGPENLMIAENTPLILPLHQDLDRIREEAAGRREDRHHRPRHRPGLRGQGRPALRSGSPTSATRRRSTPASTGCSPTTTRCARGSAPPRSTAPRCSAQLVEVAPQGAALRRAGLEGARRQAPRGPAHPVRGRAGGAPRHRLRHLPLRHLVEHAGRHGRDRHRHGAGRDRLRPRHRQGLHHPRRRGPVPGRAHRRDRPAPRRARPRVRHRHRAQAPLRLVRRGAGAPDLHHRAASTASR